MLIASGGDTLIDIIINCDNISKVNIYVIDNSLSQIILTIFKIFILLELSVHYDELITLLNLKNNLPNKSITFFDIMYNDNNNIKYVVLIDHLHNKYKYLEFSKYLLYWKKENYLNILNAGVLREGQLEKTFFHLMEISDLCFEKFFNYDTLKNIFGESAIKLSINSENNFIEKFKSIYNNYINKYSINTHENRFYYRMVNGRDNQDIINNIIMKFNDVNPMLILPNINFLYDDIYRYAENLQCVNSDSHYSNFNENNISKMRANIQKYDFIQVSNVTDWLCEYDRVDNFVKNIFNLCKFNGFALWRSLNGQYDLINLLKKTLF